jgi:hypothetical protein
VRALTADDVPWMVELMAQRRALYETFSPVFWKRSAQAREVHGPHLASCLASGRHCGFRTDDAFVLGEVQDAATPPWWSEVTLGFVDDFAVTSDSEWADAGVTLLAAVWRELARRGVKTLRVVAGRRDMAKVAVLEHLGLTVGESWWIALAVGDRRSEASFGPVNSDGVAGLVIPAPPVYDPGGPVFLAISVEDVASVPDVPRIAGECGAVLAIVSTTPATPELSEAVSLAGFDEVTRYYVGAPSHR